jgi:hypothetical protein
MGSLRAVLLSFLALLSFAARADVSRYSEAKVSPLIQRGRGPDAGKVIGFKLRLILHAESADHTTAWVGLVSQKEELKKFSFPGQVAGKSALYSVKSGHWYAHWVVENLKPGDPSEQVFTAYYKDAPNLVPGQRYQLAATFPVAGVAEEAWKHSFGADWGAGWGEPEVELPE